MSLNQGRELELAPYSESYVRISYYDIAKRAVDIAGALIGIVVFSWLFILISILIKWEDSKGPVLFMQTRIGKNGKPFKMYKFRSMVSGAEDMLEELKHLNEIEGAMFKMKDDPRVTRIGNWIRKTSIDELPQFINVLKGDMSLVGPRPPLPSEVDEYNGYHKQRLLVVPGCTGIWQVSGRNRLGFEEMVELDIEYIHKRSLWLDSVIIMKTVRVLLGTKDAF